MHHTVVAELAHAGILFHGYPSVCRHGAAVYCCGKNKNRCAGLYRSLIIRLLLQSV
jgi:hypothetical protein